MDFYVGLHQSSDAQHFDRACLSVNTVRKRKKPLGCGSWIMDSGAFTEISGHGHYRHSVEEYAATIERWSADPTLLAVVAQDYMCEPFILSITGLTVVEHQRLTIERYDALLPLVSKPLIPVLQGYAPSDYAAHVEAYGDRLKPGMWVGVGSVCKRNGSPLSVDQVLTYIRRLRPDLRLHGFGLKTTALAWPTIRSKLASADSMAWSFSARKQGRNQNDWREAAQFVTRIETLGRGSSDGFF